MPYDALLHPHRGHHGDGGYWGGDFLRGVSSGEEFKAMSPWFSKAKRQKIASSICDCGSPAETILRDVPQCARCAALEKKLYPSGWAGKAAKKHRPLIVSIEYPPGVTAPWLRDLPTPGETKERLE